MKLKLKYMMLLLGMICVLIAGCKPESPVDGWRYLGKVDNIHYAFYACGRCQTLFDISLERYRVSGNVQFNGRVMRHPDHLQAWIKNEPGWERPTLKLRDSQNNDTDCTIIAIEPIEKENQNEK